jgi:hypothetical protein
MPLNSLCERWDCGTIFTVIRFFILEVSVKKEIHGDNPILTLLGQTNTYHHTSNYEGCKQREHSSRYFLLSYIQHWQGHQIVRCNTYSARNQSTRNVEMSDVGPSHDPQFFVIFYQVLLFYGFDAGSVSSWVSTSRWSFLPAPVDHINGSSPWVVSVMVKLLSTFGSFLAVKTLVLLRHYGEFPHPGGHH